MNDERPLSASEALASSRPRPLRARDPVWLGSRLGLTARIKACFRPTRAPSAPGSNLPLTGRAAGGLGQVGASTDGDDLSGGHRVSSEQLVEGRVPVGDDPRRRVVKFLAEQVGSPGQRVKQVVEAGQVQPQAEGLPSGSSRVPGVPPAPSGHQLPVDGRWPLRDRPGRGPWGQAGRPSDPGLPADGPEARLTPPGARAVAVRVDEGGFAAPGAERQGQRHLVPDDLPPAGRCLVVVATMEHDSSW